MFTSTTYTSGGPPLSSSVPQLPATIFFNPGSVPGVPSYLPSQTGHLSEFLTHGLQIQDALSQDADLNSPAAFRRNVSLSLVEVERLQILARTLLNNIQNAYQPGMAPQLIQANIYRLQEQLGLTIQTLSQSGVGSLPLLPMPSPSPISVMPQLPTEEELLSNATKSLQILYDKVQKSQNNAAIVGNLLGSEKEKDLSGTSGPSLMAVDGVKTGMNVSG